jgi:hypothetical protein
MKFYLTIDSVRELEAFPAENRKTIWSQAWRAARKKEKKMWLGELITVCTVVLTMLTLRHVPSDILGAGIGGLLGGLFAQQLYFRVVIPYIKKQAPNQTSEPETMAVPPPAAQESRRQ